MLTPEEARKAKFKNVITRALGVFPSVMVDTLHFELDPETGCCSAPMVCIGTSGFGSSASP